MKKIVILGGGTAGTMILNRLFKPLSRKGFEFTIIDKDKNHYYQPGLLFIPFGIYNSKHIIRKKETFFPKGVNALFEEFDRIDAPNNKVIMKNGSKIPYDILVIATGCEIKPTETEGLHGGLWHKNIFDFYTLKGATALSKFLKNWEGGKLLFNIAEMPIKCPVAPIEFLFMADYFFKKRKMRDKVDIHFATPLSGAFTKQKTSEALNKILKKKGIEVTTEYNICSVDNENRQIISYDDKTIPFDLLVTIPTNMGSKAIENSEFGDELNFIPTNKHNLRSKNHENIFVIGDATNLPTSKAGSVAHYQVDVLANNIIDIISGNKPKEEFDGHSTCFISSGHGKALLIDFNYDVEPVPGNFPWHPIGPFSLLKETRTNHFGKMGFRWFYWNIMLKGYEMPISHKMQMRGKKFD